MRAIFKMMRHQVPFLWVVVGFQLSLRAYELTHQKKAFLIPFLCFFKGISWLFGFAKAHIDHYKPHERRNSKSILLIERYFTNLLVKSMLHKNRFPFVSIIILNYNGGKFLLKCLQSVLDLTEYPKFEVLLVDNGSRDDSIKRVRVIFGRSRKLKIVALRKNFGYAEGNNIGYTHISSEAKYVVFLNNDVVVEEGWLRKLITVLEEHEDIGVAQPVILTLGKINEGAWGEYMDVFGETKHKFEPKSKNVLCECFCVMGAALIARRELIDKFGLFNPQYFLNYEETDFCWRLILAGYKIAVIPSSTVYHVGSATIKKYVTSPIISFHFTKNRLYTLFVNYEAKNLIKYVPWVILSHIADMIRDITLSVLEKGRKREVYKVNALGGMMGLLYIPVHFRDIWKTRIRVQKHIRKIRDEEIIGKDAGIVVPRPPLPESILRKIKKLATFRKMP